MNILNTLKKIELEQTKKISLEKGSVFFRENDKCENIGIIESGKVSIITYLNNGNEVVFNRLKENDIFGNNLIFSKKPYYKGDIVAMSDCEIVLIGKELLVKLLKTNDDFMHEYLQIQSDFSKSLNDKIKLLSMDSAEDRFEYYMHSNNNKIEYDTISNLAKELYIKRETLSRLLTKLVKNNKIIRSSNNIMLK